MSFRSSIGQRNLPNPAPAFSVTNNVATAVSGTRNNTAISLQAGTYSVSIGNELLVGPNSVSTGSISASTFQYGLSSSTTATVAFSGLPIWSCATVNNLGGGSASVTLAADAFILNGRTFNFTLSAPTTIQLFTIATFTASGTPTQTLTLNQNAVVVKIM
jgi:hypothetical protein